ncbi:hypothetical protein B0H13DRAFT_1886286 [Mycena leptocephala]|nr:hypothetical protein B0H13DRAFT_1886286 [Mycena leptocephala]
MSSGDFEAALMALRRQIEVSQYVASCSLAVFVWDILSNVRNDYLLFFKHKSAMAAVAYIMSRIGTLIFVLGFTTFVLNPFTDCNKALIAFNSFFSVGVSGSAFLFFFHVWTAYGRDRLIRMIFGFLCLAVVGSSLAVPIGESATILLGDLNVCIVSRVEVYVGTVAIILTVHATTVFLAISYRLVSTSTHTEPQTRETVPGIDLPPLVRSLVMDGQGYYLIVVLSNLVATLLLYLPTVPLIYRGCLAIPNVMLTSVMTCRVYRNKALDAGRAPEQFVPALSPAPDGNTFPLGPVQFHSTQNTTSDMSSGELASYDKNAPQNVLHPTIRLLGVFLSKRLVVWYRVHRMFNLAWILELPNRPVVRQLDGGWIMPSVAQQKGEPEENVVG